MQADKLKEQVDKAVMKREEGDLNESAKLFKKLLQKLNLELAKNPTIEFKKVYVYAQNEFVIQKRLEAQKVLNEALEMGKDILKYDQENNISDAASIRSIANTMLDLRLFESAEEYLSMLVEHYGPNSGRLGDALSHFAFCKLRMGKAYDAFELLDKAVEAINKNTANEPPKLVAVWLAHSFIVRGQVLNALGEREKALDAAKRAYEIATKADAVFRKKQAHDLIVYLESHNAEVIAERIKKSILEIGY